MNTRLEHANIVVRDVDATIRFLSTAFPEFRVRFDGIDGRGRRWVHIGTDTTYIALGKATIEPDSSWIPYSGALGVNHLAYVVDDVDAVQARLTLVGYKNSTVFNNHPYRKRIYFYDPDGNDWEFVQYLSEKTEEQNDYLIPDAGAA